MKCCLCSSELYLVWSFCIPIDSDKVYAAEAHRGWQLQCEAGHVVAFSENTETTADSAEDFDPRDGRLQFVRWTFDDEKVMDPKEAKKLARAILATCKDAKKISE